MLTFHINICIFLLFIMSCTRLYSILYAVLYIIEICLGCWIRTNIVASVASVFVWWYYIKDTFSKKSNRRHRNDVCADENTIQKKIVSRKVDRQDEWEIMSQWRILKHIGEIGHSFLGFVEKFFRENRRIRNLPDLFCSGRFRFDDCGRSWISQSNCSKKVRFWVRFQKRKKARLVFPKKRGYWRVLISPTIFFSSCARVLNVENCNSSRGIASKPLLESFLFLGSLMWLVGFSFVLNSFKINLITAESR